MIGLIVGELIVAVVLSVAFLVAFGVPWRSPDTEVRWHLTTFTAAVGALVILLLIAVLGVNVPAWLGAAVLGGLDASLAWRLVLSLRGRHRP